jgi:hypothetical protein
VAPATGPFPMRHFLRTLREHGPQDGSRLSLVEGPDALVAIESCGSEVRLSGHPDLVDYHTPLGSGVSGVVAELASDLPPATTLDFDSLPVEAADAVTEGLETAGLAWTRERHAVTAVLPLPDTFEDYLHAIGKKERHEVRRKRRRYVETVGELVHETHAGEGWAFDEFVRLHRLAQGPKGTVHDRRHAAALRLAARASRAGGSICCGSATRNGPAHASSDSPTRTATSSTTRPTTRTCPTARRAWLCSAR